jgi:carbon storage regulator
MMLILSRKVGEEVAIGNNIRLTVVEIRGNFVRLGLTAPKQISIRRQELGRLASCADDADSGLDGGVVLR